LPSRRRHWRRENRNRAGIFVDNDNLVMTFNDYGVRKTLTDLMDWIGQPEHLGITQVTCRYVFTTVRDVDRPLPEETGLERRRPLAVRMHNYPFPGRGKPGYEDEVIWDQIVASRTEWDTAVIVMSDHKAFEWADRIHYDTSGIFAAKEAVVIYGHLTTRTELAQNPRNGVSLEQIYPDLNERYIDLRGHNPLRAANSMPA
jgi:hypothetical protein